ncbi:hypothetical protein LSPH26S_01807 [Lysinibacillus sphaericus]
MAAASAEQLADGSFQEVIEQPGLGTKTESVERIVLGTGKVMINLAGPRERWRRLRSLTHCACRTTLQSQQRK